MRLFLLTCLLISLLSPVQAQFRVSDNHHYLLRDGKPFFWLGDTAWELFHALSRDEADRYLERRAEQGFTVIQAVALAELDGLNTPNANGDKPLLNNDPTTPNDVYFRHVDYIVDKAADLGLTIGLLPTWGDKIDKRWGKGPVIFTPETAKGFGRYVGNRYKNRSNIIWIMGGDRNPETTAQQTICRRYRRRWRSRKCPDDVSSPAQSAGIRGMVSQRYVAGFQYVSERTLPRSDHLRQNPVGL